MDNRVLVLHTEDAEFPHDLEALEDRTILFDSETDVDREN